MSFGIPGQHVLNRRIYRFGLEHHAAAAAVWRSVAGPVPIGGVVPDVVKVDFDQPAVGDGVLKAKGYIVK